MATLTVLKFPEADGVDRMISRLEDLQKMEMIKIEDAAIVSWPEARGSPGPANSTIWPVSVPWTALFGGCSSA